MKVLYITDALAVWGGIERVLRDKMDYLVEQYGYEVYIVTTDQGHHSIPYPLNSKVNVYDLDVRFHYQYRFHGIKRIFKYFELKKLFENRLEIKIRDIRPDIIVCIRLEFINTIIKAKGKIPLICESHSLCYAPYYENASIWNKLKWKRLRKNVSKADCIVALTKGDANDWKKYNSTVYVIPNVVFLNDSGRIGSLQSKIAIFVGRFSEQKDVWSLLEIWKIVHLRYPDWELHMYGEGELKCQFEETIRDININISIFPPTTDIFEKYLESSFLLLTSKYEPFGLVIPEAMSCGLPVLSFDCPYGPADIIRNGINGYLVENHDINAYADKVSLLIENKEMRMRMGTNAILEVRKFRSDRIMPQWYNLFNSIVK